MRVVSLHPAATDALVALGAPVVGALVGRSHECDGGGTGGVPVLTSSKLGAAELDADAAHAAASGGWAQLLWEASRLPAATRARALLEWALSVYRVDVAALLRARPTVVLTQTQARYSGGAVQPGEVEEALQAVLGYAPTLVHLDPKRLGDVWEDVRAVARAVGVGDGGDSCVRGLQARVANAAAIARGRPRRRVACVQWASPLYAAGAWVPELVELAGGVDVFCEAGGDSVPFEAAELAKAAPDALVFAICGVTRQEAAAEARKAMAAVGRKAWAAIPAARRGAVAVVEANRLFSRPGPLLADSLEVLVEILHPDAQPFGHRAREWDTLDAIPAS